MATKRCIDVIRAKWTLETQQDLLAYHGIISWETRRAILIQKLNDPKEDPNTWDDTDRADLKIILDEELNA